MPTEQIAFELDSNLDGIGMPPSLIMDLGTQYGKVAKIEFSENTFIADRLIPIPHSKHASNKLYISEAFKKQLELNESGTSYCTIIEPEFVQKVKIKEISEESVSDLSPVIKPIADKSVIYLNMLLRHDNNKIYKVIELPGKRKTGIITEKTKFDIQTPPKKDDDSKGDDNTQKTNDDTEYTSFSTSDFSNDSTSGLENRPSLDGGPISFENLNKLKGIDHVIHRVMTEVIAPFFDGLKNPNETNKVGACLLYGPPGCGKTV